MKTIPLTQGYEAVVNDADYPLLSKYKWHVVLYGVRRDRPYAVGWVSGVAVKMHRLLLGVSAAEHVDHINGNGLDNRRSNIRPCSLKQNLQNSGPRKGRSFKGVCDLGKGKFSARFNRKHIGTFRTGETAAMAYDFEARKANGEFAWCNFPVDKLCARAVKEGKVASDAKWRIPRRGFKGVVFHNKTKSWNVRVRANKASHSFGYHKDQEAAARVYDGVARAIWGKDCYLNYPQERHGLSPKAANKAAALRCAVLNEF